MDVDSRQKNADDCEAGEVLNAREQASFLIYTPWARSLRMPKASRFIVRRLFSPNAMTQSEVPGPEKAGVFLIRGAGHFRLRRLN